MKRLINLLTGNLSKVTATQWLNEKKQDINFSKLELVIDQSQSLIFSQDQDQIVCSYQPSCELTYYSPNKLIIPEDTRLESTILSSLIIKTYDLLIQSSIKLLKQSIPEDRSNLRSDEEQLKALEWLKVSLTVLEKALDHCLENKELFYRGFLYVYKRQGVQIHLTSMSLSFILVFKDNGILQISTWNNKDQDPNFQRDPDMSMEFGAVKNQAFDLFIPLLVKISKISTQGL